MPTDSMEALLQEAEAKGLWLFVNYQQLWWSPAELRAAQARGQFRWSPVNFQLRDPRELLKQKRDAVEAAIQEVREIEQRMGMAPPAPLPPR